MTSKQRAHLRKLAHPLKPLLHVGKDGASVASVRALRQAFNTRELVKVRVLDNAPDGPRGSAEALAAEVEGASVVAVAGRNAVIYRPDPDDPQIQLP
ncbi:MAG TPA: YhbY family RNA-binding protein [Bacteroidetes bacterium]|nr:YhbY family RNA-binding protein [Bacteroidota bacterium]HIL56441.1 YhbY family RNA-binding protein [Rhodothermales bacterium]